MLKKSLLFACAAVILSAAGYPTAAVSNSLTFDTNPLLGCTFLGGSDDDNAQRGSITVDAEGNVYIVSRTMSADFPFISGAYDSTYDGGGDICISKFSPDLSTLIASTFFGSVGEENTMRNTSIVLDALGNVFVAGQALFATYFPTTDNAYDTSYNGSSDVFVSKFSGDLSTLLASTLLGTAGYEEANSIAIDQNGDVFIAGYTRHTQFPTTPGAYDSTYAGTGSMQWGGDLFVAKFDPDLTTLLASTLVGGSDWDEGSYMAIDSYGKVIITGTTNSSDFPVTPTAYDTIFHGGSYGGDVYVSKLSNDLTTLEASTFLGGNANDWAYGITLDAGGNVYITGHIPSPDFPTSPDAFDRVYDGIGGADVGDDSYVSKLSNDLTILLASTFLGGSCWENGNALAVDDEGNVYVGGNTTSNNFSTIPGSYDTLFNGGVIGRNGDAFVSKFDANLTTLIASTFLGGSGQESVHAIALDGDGNVYAEGFSNSLNFPTQPDSYDPDYNGGSGDAYSGDVFIALFPIEYFTDSDNDSIVDPGDNCPLTPNTDQSDIDQDTVGDLCDNCPDVPNPGQEDSDQDNVGDACEGVCGDANDDEAINILDVTYIVNYLYKEGPEPDPIEVADANGDGNINILDVTHLVNYLYKNGPDPIC
ncbi:MAG: SBBP repeat-containing protein [Candidatus Zixiibacteriota bacterium]|nr:MAG: SBBP repeat-containing protein [candidate division Zixibacteria bacterium]